MYMAPEQVRSAKHVDARADIWSLGVVLYELLCGRRPFEAATPSAVYAAIVTDLPPSLRSVRSDIPAKLESVVLRCLAKSAAERFDSVAELAVALAPFGGKDAATSAARIKRVLAKRSSRPSAPDGGPQPSPVPSASPYSTTVSGTHGAWGSSASVRGRRSTPARRRRWKLVTIGTATLVVLMFAGKLLLSGGERGAPANSAAAALVERQPTVSASSPAQLDIAPPQSAASSAASASPSVVSSIVARPPRTKARSTPKPTQLGEDSAMSHR
jgi:serine/threonine-protein kinase